MIDLAYVQRKDDDWLNESSFALVQGLRLFGTEVRGFVPEQLPDLELTPAILVHGGIGCVRRALERLGAGQPDAFGGMPPVELLPFYGRRVWATTMREVRRRLDSDDHVFVKPLRAQKAFTGHVTSGKCADLIVTASLDDEFEVLCSEPVCFVSEYRCFVHQGAPVGLRHYAGDCLVFPDSEVVAAAVRAWRGPEGYALDFGVTDDGRTLLVEGNDGFALGCYGLHSCLYARLVSDRWEQLVAGCTPAA